MLSLALNFNSERYVRDNCPAARDEATHVYERPKDLLNVLAIVLPLKNSSLPSDSFLHIIDQLRRNQANLLIQLRTCPGDFAMQIGSDYHLRVINHADGLLGVYRSRLSTTTTMKYQVAYPNPSLRPQDRVRACSIGPDTWRAELLSQLNAEYPDHAEDLKYATFWKVLSVCLSITRCLPPTSVTG